MNEGKHNSFPFNSTAAAFQEPDASNVNRILVSYLCSASFEVCVCVYVYTISLIRKQLLSTRDNSQSDRHPWSFCMFACCSRAQSSQVLLDENQEQKNVVMRLSELYKYDAQPSYSDVSIRLPLEVDGWMNGWNYAKFKEKEVQQ